MLLAKQQPTMAYSYGYERFEILSGFSNAVLLIFLSLFLFFEMIERFIHQPPVESGPVMVLTVLGFLVNVFAVVVFHKHTLMRSESKRAQESLRISKFQRIMIDSLSYFCVLLSALLVDWGWRIADPIAAAIISVLVLFTALPLAKDTGRVLLQATPLKDKDTLYKLLREAQTEQGVLDITNEHFWTQSPGVVVGSVQARVRSDANEQHVLNRISKLFAPYVSHLTVQIEKDDWVLNSQNVVVDHSTKHPTLDHI